MQRLPGLGDFGRISKRLVASYALDWIFLIAIGAVTYGLNQIDPVYHPFSLLDLSIAYPYKDELVSTTSLVLAAIVGPGIIILLVSLLLVPGPYASKHVPVGMLIRRKIWEWHTGWLGLALSIIMTLFITTGLKNAFGKPRPNALARCKPDTSDEAIRQHSLGGYASGYAAIWVLVDHNICTETDPGILHDAFRSFPSGHSSTSWAGLLYLSLYLCSKFALVFPFLPGSETRDRRRPQHQYQSLRGESENSMELKKGPTNKHEDELTKFNGRRNEAAAPPIYLLLTLMVPIGTAFYICASRWFDYRHHGFDIISGSLIGIFTAWFSFRLYHMPIARGSGWSWGPRSPRRAFGVGVGSLGWVSPADLPERETQDDLEMGLLPTQRNLETRDAASPSVPDEFEARGPAFAPASLGVPAKSPQTRDAR